MEANLKMNTSTGQVYINNKCLHQDEKGYYTISSYKNLMKVKIQQRDSITDPQLIERINKFCN
jgi:uncharacterized membrane protein YcgQ (UPF0703/DUF1980 family)